MKKYTAPELEIMEFELEDVLTVSQDLENPTWNDSDPAWKDFE